MTALTAMQSAAVRLIGRKPIVFFGSEETFEVEICDLLNDVAREIAESHDWQSLHKTHEIAGDGAATSFPLPSDYQRMLLDSRLFDPNTWAWGYHYREGLPDFLRTESTGLYGAPGVWTMTQDAFRFSPAPSGTTLFPYVTKLIVRDADDVSKAAFTADSDKFRLDERLLTLALVWRWRAQKALGYREDMANFELALSRAQAKDGGARVIRRNGLLPAGNYAPAWPWELG